MKITNSVLIVLYSLLSLLILYVMVITDSWLLRLNWLGVLILIVMAIRPTLTKKGETPVD